MKPFPRTSLIRFSRNLRRQRLRRGFTQERLAEKLDISPRHYQKLEAATVTPTFGVLVRAKKVLKVKWETLLGGA
ncbi:MAG: helix-turn-helix transcriptional regulator [Terrimicrobiaceae bacterium]|nr:helix-turn-helix domain-containing protein [Terrimicrobiaceae bacterium]